MDFVTWRRNINAVSLLLTSALAAGLLISNFTVSVSAPEWLRVVALEIQAACRDVGTQWMVTICLLSYFVAFSVLERRISNTTPHPVPLPGRSGEGVAGAGQKLSTSNAQRSTSTDKVWPSAILRLPSTLRRRAISRLLTSISLPNIWLLAFTSFVLLRYAFAYESASKSLQVVVLLTGIVVGKGIAFWVGWVKHPTFNAQCSTSNLRNPVATSSGCATFSPSGAEKETEAEGVLESEKPRTRPSDTLSPSDGERDGVRGGGAHGVTRPTGNHTPSTVSRARAVLSMLAVLLACAALWQPEYGMEFQYRGIRRWTGAWDNPNLYGLLMGVGTTLALGLLILGKRPTSNVQHSTPDWRQSAIRYAECLLFPVAAGLCAFGLVKSYSRGAWVGTAAGIGFLIWKWLNHEIHKIHESGEQSGSPLPASCHPLPVRGGEGQGEGSGLRASCFSRIWRISWLKKSLLPILVLILSALVICFWQFRHTEQPVVRRIFSVANMNDFSWRNRVATWSGAVEMMWARPFAGHGWSGAEDLFRQKYKPERLEDSAAIQMNDYLMIGISAGLPALVCFGVVLWLALNRGWAGRGSLQPAAFATDTDGAHGVTRPAINNPPSTIAAAAAIVLLVGFWFDGGLFKLPTCVVFWVLLELARNSRDEAVMGGARHSVRAGPLDSTSGAHGVTRSTIGLRWLAGIIAAWAIGVTVLHLGVPHLEIGERTLGIARKHLVPPKQKNDFEFLAAKSIWSGCKLKTLLTHVELAHYNRELVNWKLDDQMYQDFVLSPEIESEEIHSSRPTGRGWPPGRERGEDMNWRRELWEYFYPRIRKESNMDAAAEIVMRHLGRRVAVVSTLAGDGNYVQTESVSAMWQRGEAGELGFEMLSVAALRSAGIPARLSGWTTAEFWNGTDWKVVPR